MSNWGQMERCVRHVYYAIERGQITRATEVDDAMQACSQTAIDFLSHVQLRRATPEQRQQVSSLLRATLAERRDEQTRTVSQVQPGPITEAFRLTDDPLAITPGDTNVTIHGLREDDPRRATT